MNALILRIPIVWMLMLFGGGLLLTGCGDTDVEVPAVVGKTAAAARVQLESLKFKVVETPQAVAGGTAGQVVDQDPKAGVKVAAASAVTVFVAAAQAPLTVPNVVRVPFAQAKAQLEAAGLQVRRKPEPKATLEFRAEEVVSQEPAPFSAAAPGMSVDLEVAGPSVAVPDVTGKGLQQATEIMAASKLLVEVGGVKSDSRQPVASTTPQAQEVVLEGTTITLELQEVPRVTVPGVLNKMFDAAKSELEAAGLRVVRKDPPRPVRDMKGGEVISQDPAAGSSVTKDTVIEVEIAADLPYGNDTCRQGFVWRDAFPGDHVCVTGETRSRAAADNAQAGARRSPFGGPYGPDTCLPGFVWREANPTDHVCVTPDIRAQAAQDNSQAPQRRVLP